MIVIFAFFYPKCRYNDLAQNAKNEFWINSRRIAEQNYRTYSSATQTELYSSTLAGYIIKTK